MSGVSTSLYTLVVIVVLCVGFSAASLVRSTRTDAPERVEDFEVSSTNVATWTALGRSWSVQLSLSDVVEDNEEYFHGTLHGDSKAVVSMALLPGDDLSGMIMTGYDTYWLSRKNSVMYMSSESTQESTRGVPPTFSEPRTVVDVDSDDLSVPRATVSTYKVSVFFDQDWASASNNPWSSQSATMALFNEVNAIYKASGLGQFSVVYQHQVSNSQSTISGMLDYWANTKSTQLASFKDTSFTNQLWLVGKNVGGLAHVGYSCKGTSGAMKYKTAVAGLVNFSRLWTVKTIAHELAHNRGAAHVFGNQCAGSQSSGCQCSVMSYCFPSASNNPQGATNWFDATAIAAMKSAGCY
eukprot:TRINITY_DN3922_c0_g2_i1.p1 TRINITY_DN3922_c0_g2~~TRINITY_DN3922_c0_g2_i1.p1  ORF type:complete len:353 (-),score=56.71 TRINITY_DN3922_c0_g2_i1:145-1203(-)